MSRAKLSFKLHKIHKDVFTELCKQSDSTPEATLEKMVVHFNNTAINKIREKNERPN